MITIKGQRMLSGMTDDHKEDNGPMKGEVLWVNKTERNDKNEGTH